MKVDADSDARALRRLVSAGPTVSIYFDLAAPLEEEVNGPRWHALLDRIARQGIDPALREALTVRARSSSLGTGVLAAFISDGDTAPTVVEMPGAQLPEMVVHATLPYVRPLLAWLQSRPLYVLAVAGREGAEIEIHRGGRQETIVRTVTAPADDVRTPAPGRGTRKRAPHPNQNDSWERNAAHVAKTLTDELLGGRTRLLLLAGDIRALTHVDQHLPGGLRSQVCVRYVVGGNPADDARHHPGGQIDQQIHAWLREQDQRLLSRIADGRNGNGWAVEGATATLGALSDGRVRQLAVVDDPLDRRTAWFGPAPAHAALDRETLTRAGAAPVRSAPLIDVALRAALLTGAETRILPPGTSNTPAEGIGALCRFGG